jgi:predicted lipase
MPSNFKELLIKIIDTGNIDQSLYSSLSDEHKKIIDMLFSNNIIYKLHNQEELDKMINRFNIVKGEIMIGNDNPQLLKELKYLVLTLVNYNMLDYRQINQLLIYLFHLI